MMNSEEQNKDTHKKSISEACINAFGGYPIAYGIGIFLLPLMLGWLEEDPFVANAVFTLVYTAASVIRSYILRRVFERLGVDDNFIRLAVKLYRRIRDRPKKGQIQTS